MNLHRICVLTATGGALAYTVAKVDLAIRGELGMPGFPAPASAYDSYEPVSGQLSNAATGLAMAVLIAWLARPPRRRWLRIVVLTLSWLGVAVVGSGVAGFVLRATGIAPVLGAPADSAAAWVALAVGALWAAAWTAATLGATRRRPQTATP